MIHLPEIKKAELSTYQNFAKCHQARGYISIVIVISAAQS